MKSDYIEISEFRKIIVHLNHPYDLIMSVALETGARIGDIVALPYSALTDRSINYTAQKTGKSCSCKLSNKLYIKLACRSGEKWLFPSDKSKSGHITRQAVYKNVRKVAEALGVKNHVSPHSARKTFAVGLLREKGLNAVQKALQHESVGTTALYCFSDVMQKKRSGDNNIDFEAFADLIADKVVDRLNKRLDKGEGVV